MDNINFEGILLTVKDLNTSRSFYEKYLEQVSLYDHDYDGQMVCYASGISLAPEKVYETWLSEGTKFQTIRKNNSSQLYFETENIDELYEKICRYKKNRLVTWNYSLRLWSKKHAFL